jgi:hypothetical protein
MLLLSVSSGASCAGFVTARPTSTIVWVDKSATAKREIPKTRKIAAAPIPQIRYATAIEDRPLRQTALLDKALFQRPPPSRFLNRP